MDSNKRISIYLCGEAQTALEQLKRDTGTQMSRIINHLLINEAGRQLQGKSNDNQNK